MTEPQVWTLIGVFAAALFAVPTLMSTMFVRVIRAEIGAVRSELEAVRSDMRAEVGGIRSDIRALAVQVDSLDGDVRALVKHTFGLDRD